MGCFSYLCKICDKGILSTSYRGEMVTLYHLVDGKVVEEMTGEYDSYGRVFDENMESRHWKEDWDTMVDQQFGPDLSSGIAAIHVRCKHRGMIPTERSDDDPNQGWGDDESEESLEASVNQDLEINGR